MAHAIGGVLGVVGFAVNGRYSRISAQVIGSAAFLLAILSFVPIRGGTLAASVIGAPLPMFETVAHLLIGVVGVFTGFGRKND